MSARARLLALTAAALFLARWFLHGDDGTAPATGAAAREASRAEFEWQCRTILDRPAVAAFTAGTKKVPAPGRLAVLVVTAAGTDAKELLQAAQAQAASADVAWVAPDEAVAKESRAAAGEEMPGAVAPAVCALVEPARRPALLVVGTDGKIAYAHFGGDGWDPQALADEVATLRHAADPTAPAVKAPAPAASIRGALACAACHRAEFADWLLTPHSVAMDDLGALGKDADKSCVQCHVTGWQQPGGFADVDSSRRLAQVQCEACHEPARTHGGEKKLRREEYAARCRACHTPSASIAPDIRLSVPSVSHPSAKDSPGITWEMRGGSIESFHRNAYFQFCARTAYVGSESCKTCHAASHKHWAATPHAGAFETLRKAGKEKEARCVRCHSTGYGHEGGFQDAKTTPAVAEVGCESCHGPGKMHVEAGTREERLATIFRFDEKCPTCVVTRICRTCHDTENDPDFNLTKALERVKHRDK